MQQAFRQTTLQRTVTTGALSFLVALFFLLAPSLAKADVNQTDAGAQAGISGRLYHAGIYKHGNVQVTVENGVATLAGTVDSYGEEQRAVREASRQSGVTRVVDRIQVNTAGATTEQILAQARHDVLMYPFYTVFDHITLSAEGNQLTVNGQVTQPYKKSDLGNILAGIRGVSNLQNNLEVLPVSQTDDAIRLAVARRIYRDPMFVNYANQANPPIHIVVKNMNVTLYGAVGSNVERQEAMLDARFATTYLGLTNQLRIAS